MPKVRRTTINRLENLIITELRGPAFLRVANPWASFEDQKVYPEVYFLAAGELLTVMLGVSWIISFSVMPQSVVDPTKKFYEDNALKRRIGYNNLCVGFDVPPAKYVAAIAWIFIAHVGIKYGFMDMQRSLLVRNRLTPFKFWFSILTDLLYMAAWAGFVLTFVIPPWQSVWGHSIGFMFLGVTTWLVLLANVMEGKNMPGIVWLFVIVYGIFTITDFGLAGVNFFYNGDCNPCKGPWNPWWVGMCADYGWFATLAFTSMIMPKAEAIHQPAITVGSKIGKPAHENYIQVEHA